MIASAVAIAIALGASSALAGDGFNGPYGGLKLGYGFGQYSGDYTTPSGSTTLDGIGSRGPSVGALAGYGRTFGQKNDVYLGGELDVTMSSITADTSTSGGSTAEITEQHSGIAAARAGFLPHENWLLFGRLGVGATQHEVELAGSGMSQTHDERQMTYLAGVGVEGMVAENVSLRMDWSYRFQEEETFFFGNDTLTVEPATGIAEIAVTYHF